MSHFVFVIFFFWFEYRITRLYTNNSRELHSLIIFYKRRMQSAETIKRLNLNVFFIQVLIKKCDDGLR